MEKGCENGRRQATAQTRAGNETPSVSTYLFGDFLMPRSGLHPIKSLEQAQVMQKQTSNSSASALHCGSLRVSGCAPTALGKVPGEWGTLTLSTDGPLPAFFADTREGLAVDHTGAPIIAGVG